MAGFWPTCQGLPSTFLHESARSSLTRAPQAVLERRRDKAMFGFVFGTACLVGLLWVLKGGRHGCRGGGRRGWRGAGISHGLSFLFRRLDTTPGQEKVIRSAAQDVMKQTRELRESLSSSRADVARALRDEPLDPETLVDALGRHEDALAELKRTLAGSLAQVHEVLDAGQRDRLADLIESAPRRWGGPYRTAI